MGARTGDGELDDEPTRLDDLSVRLTEPQWRRFELDGAALTAKMDPAAVVQHDHTAIGRVSGRRRQVDVLVSGFIGGCPLSVAIECKSSPKPLEISAVDEFAGKLIDLSVDSGVLYTAGRHTTGAQARAAGATQPKVELRHLSPELPDPPWRSGLPELFTGFGDCPNDNCYTGDTSWRPWPQIDDQIVEAGSCDTCGTWAVRCPECGSETGFFDDVVDCDGCERRFQLQWDRKGSEVDEVLLLDSSR